MATAHLTADELQQFRSKALSAKQFGLASRHLQACDACARRLRDGGVPAAPGLASDVEHLSYEAMTAVIDQSATAAEREWVADHSRVCAACSRQLRELQDFEALLAEPERQAARPVAEKTRTTATGWGFWTWVNASLAAAMAVAFVVLGTMSRVRHETSTAVSAGPVTTLPLDTPLVIAGLVIAVGLVFALLVAASRRRHNRTKRRKP